MQIAGSNGGWFSVRVYSLSLCLKRPTTRQQENARALLATQGKNSLGAQHAPRGGGVGLVHLEVNSDPQHTGALSVPMRLPRLPSHNNSWVEKSFQAFKFSDNKPIRGRRHKDRAKVRSDRALPRHKHCVPNIYTGIFRYFIKAGQGTKLCLGTNVCGHKSVWSQTCVDTKVSGHKRVWVQTCLGTNYLGTNVSGH